MAAAERRRRSQLARARFLRVGFPTLTLLQGDKPPRRLLLRYAPPPVATPTVSSGGGLIGLLIPDRPDSDSGLATGRSVWVLRDGAPVEVAVTVGASDGTRTEIRDSTLAAGDAVIIDQRTGE